MHCDCFIKFEDLIFVYDKLPVKTAKITSLEKLNAYVTTLYYNLNLMAVFYPPPFITVCANLLTVSLGLVFSLDWLISSTTLSFFHA